MRKNNFEKAYLRANPHCEYCEASGTVRQSEVVLPRRIGEKEYFVAICWKHYQMLLEIESEGFV